MNKLACVALLGATVSMGNVYAYGKLELEPCMNGGVSSTGMYPTQALEDKARRVAHQNAAHKKAAAGPVTTKESVKEHAVKTSAH